MGIRWGKQDTMFTKKKKQTQNKSITLRLSARFLKKIDKQAKAAKLTRSDMVRHILVTYSDYVFEIGVKECHLAPTNSSNGFMAHLPREAEVSSITR